MVSTGGAHGGTVPTHDALSLTAAAIAAPVVAQRKGTVGRTEGLVGGTPAAVKGVAIPSVMACRVG